MTIAFDAKRAYQNSTGLGNHSRNHIAMVAGFDEVKKIIAFTPKVKIDDLRLKNPKIQRINPTGLWCAAPSLWRRVALGTSAQLRGADIYHGLSAELPSDIHRFSGKKIVTIHDVLFKTRPGDYSVFDRKIHDYKLQKAINSADQIHCISRYTADELVSNYRISSERCKVIYQSVHPDFYNASAYVDLVKPPFEKFILSVGTIEARKNTTALLSAALELHVPVVLIGKIKNAYRKEVGPLYEKLKSIQLLHHAIPQDTRELAAWYAHAYLVVYPSKAEGFGLPPLEAAAAGKICITGPSPCLTEASGLPELQTSGSAQDIATALTTLWNQPSVVEQLAHIAHEHSLNLSPERISREWLHFYTSIMNTG